MRLCAETWKTQHSGEGYDRALNCSLELCSSRLGAHWSFVRLAWLITGALFVSLGCLIKFRSSRYNAFKSFPRRHRSTGLRKEVTRTLCSRNHRSSSDPKVGGRGDGMGGRGGGVGGRGGGVGGRGGGVGGRGGGVSGGWKRELLNVTTG